MNKLEVIEYLNNHYLVEGSPVNPSIEECEKHNAVVDMSIDALEKQIPKKMIKEIINGRFNRKCPNGCEITSVTTYTSVDYCPYCGQKID